MTEPRQIAVVRDYPALLEALRLRAVELKVTRQQIAEIAGIAEGYAGTLLTQNSRKSFGLNTMGPLLGALGLRLVVEEDADALKPVKNRLGGSVSWRMLNGAENKPVILRFARRHYRKMGLLSTEGRMQKIPKRTRSRIARQAAKARWNPPDVTEMTAEERANYLKYQEQKARRKRAKTKRRRSN